MQIVDDKFQHVDELGQVHKELVTAQAQAKSVAVKNYFWIPAKTSLSNSSRTNGVYLILTMLQT